MALGTNIIPPPLPPSPRKGVSKTLVVWSIAAALLICGGIKLGIFMVNRLLQPSDTGEILGVRLLQPSDTGEVPVEEWATVEDWNSSRKKVSGDPYAQMACKLADQEFVKSWARSGDSWVRFAEKREYYTPKNLAGDVIGPSKFTPAYLQAAQGSGSTELPRAWLRPPSFYGLAFTRMLLNNPSSRHSASGRAEVIEM
jgi:hypothetical protein